MNPRIQKITADIAKLRRKIASSQARLRELERQKLELENADIVAAVRAIDVPPEEIATLIARITAPPSKVGNAQPTIKDEEDLPFEEA